MTRAETTFTAVPLVLKSSEWAGGSFTFYKGELGWEIPDNYDTHKPLASQAILLQGDGLPINSAGGYTRLRVSADKMVLTYLDENGNEGVITVREAYNDLSRRTVEIFDRLAEQDLKISNILWQKSKQVSQQNSLAQKYYVARLQKWEELATEYAPIKASFTGLTDEEPNIPGYIWLPPVIRHDLRPTYSDAVKTSKVLIRVTGDGGWAGVYYSDIKANGVPVWNAYYSEPYSRGVNIPKYSAFSGNGTITPAGTVVDSIHEGQVFVERLQDADGKNGFRAIIWFNGKSLVVHYEMGETRTGGVFPVAKFGVEVKNAGGNDPEVFLVLYTNTAGTTIFAQGIHCEILDYADYGATAIPELDIIIDRLGGFVFKPDYLPTVHTNTLSTDEIKSFDDRMMLLRRGNGNVTLLGDKSFETRITGKTERVLYAGANNDEVFAWLSDLHGTVKWMGGVTVCAKTQGGLPTGTIYITPAETYTFKSGDTALVFDTHTRYKMNDALSWEVDYVVPLPPNNFAFRWATDYREPLKTSVFRGHRAMLHCNPLQYKEMQCNSAASLKTNRVFRDALYKRRRPRP